MISVDERGRDARVATELEWLFALVGAKQATIAKRGVVKLQQLRTCGRAVNFTIAPCFTETAHVVRVCVREDVSGAGAAEIVYINGSAAYWLVHDRWLELKWLHITRIAAHRCQAHAHTSHTWHVCVCVYMCVRVCMHTHICVCVYGDQFVM